MKRHFVPSRPNLSVIKIEPRRVTLLIQGASAAESYMDIVDIENSEAHRIMVNIGDNMESPRAHISSLWSDERSEERSGPALRCVCGAIILSSLHPTS